MQDVNAPLNIREIARLLESTPVALRELVTQLPDRITGWHPAPGKWCIREVVGHLTEEDKRDFAGRISTMLEADEPRLAVNDQDAVARMRQDCAKNLGALLDEFNSMRSASVELVLNLKETDLVRGGIRPRMGRIQVVDVLHEWVYHDLNHIRQIGANVQRLLWANFGNIQPFYDPC
jgi:hypothetical protein